MHHKNYSLAFFIESIKLVLRVATKQLNNRGKKMSDLTKEQFKTVGDELVAMYKKYGGSYVTRYSTSGSRVKRVKLYGSSLNDKKRESIQRAASRIAKKHNVKIKLKSLCSYGHYGTASVAFYIS